MDDVDGVDVLECAQQLPGDVLDVDVFADVSSDHCVQVRVHELEHQVQVYVILRLFHRDQLDDVVVGAQLLQEHDFSESALSISRVREGSKDLFESDSFSVFLFNGLPHYSIGAFAKLDG